MSIKAQACAFAESLQQKMIFSFISSEIFYIFYLSKPWKITTKTSLQPVTKSPKFLKEIQKASNTCPL